MYAKNTGKRVIPLLLDGAQLKGWFLFKFGRIDCIDTTNSLQFEKLVKNLSDWTGKGGTSASASKTKPTSLEVLERPKKEDANKDLHLAVDLGLSVKWATCNVGAEKPEDYGEYFAWGETEVKEDYCEDTYKWCDVSENMNILLTKYCTDKKDANFDNKTVLELKDDVAHVKWGSDWRIPTKYEINELCEKCTWKWTSFNGVKGYVVIGPNGNSIFLPATGSHNGTNLESCGLRGYYWSATLYKERCHYAYFLGLSCCSIECDGYIRYYSAFSVRPVCD